MDQETRRTASVSPSHIAQANKQTQSITRPQTNKHIHTVNNYIVNNTKTDTYKSTHREKLTDRHPSRHKQLIITDIQEHKNTVINRHITTHTYTNSIIDPHKHIQTTSTIVA